MFGQFLKNTKGLPGSRSYFARPWSGSSYGNLSQVGGDDDDDDGDDHDDDDGDDHDKLILFSRVSYLSLENKIKICDSTLKNDYQATDDHQRRGREERGDCAK